jgi:hypothetical protein
MSKHPTAPRAVPLPMVVPITGMTVDVKQALEEMIADALVTYNWAYPQNTLETSRAHPALQKLSTNLKSMQTLLKAIK